MVYITNYDLVIIGNGYDLHYNLPTRFYDFYMSIKNSERILDDYLKLYNTNNVKLMKEYYNALQKMRVNNFFLQYFNKYNEIFEEWNQFEEHLKKIINEFIDILNNIKSNYETGYKNINNKECFAIRMPTTIFNYVYKCGIYEIITDDSTKDSTKYISFNFIQHDTNNKDYYNKVCKFIDLFPEELYKDLQEFSDLFSIYLKTFITMPVRKKINVNIKATQIVTYNYTNIAEKLFNSQTSYIHGSLDDGNKIVIGINDNENLGKFDIFTKNILRCNCNNGLNVEVNARSIAVIGHSLNELDFDTLKYLLNKNGRYHTIDIYYYSANDLAKIRIARNLKNLLGKDKYENFFNANVIKYIPY